MRGKKVDNDFLSSFIAECASLGKGSAKEIVASAKDLISEIDNKIKEVETLKIKRSKLLDVINMFDIKNKNNENEIKSLPYFNIKNQNICKFICDSLQLSGLKIDSIKSTIHSSDDILFCIKQLLEHKIIYRTGDCLLRGNKFNEYLQTITGNN
jgi:hypothetical protein